MWSSQSRDYKLHPEMVQNVSFRAIKIFSTVHVYRLHLDTASIHIFIKRPRFYIHVYLFILILFILHFQFVGSTYCISSLQTFI